MSEFAELRELVGCSCPPLSRKSARVVCIRCGAATVTNGETSESLAEDFVTYVGIDARPPAFAIAAAESAAARVVCHKSRRGVSVYRMIDDLGDGIENCQHTMVSGYNGPPWVWDGDDPDYELACDGSAACRKDCAERCVHAEERALLAMVPALSDAPSSLRMVHVKIDDSGRAVPGKPPCCVKCSRLILDQGIGGIWLYEALPGRWVNREGGTQGAPGVWRYYPTKDFHEITMANLGLYQVGKAAR